MPNINWQPPRRACVSEPQYNKGALVVWGGWDGHTPQRSAEIVRDMLGEHGFDVTLENSTSAYADPLLGENDLIVPAVTMSQI